MCLWGRIIGACLVGPVWIMAADAGAARCPRTPKHRQISQETNPHCRCENQGSEKVTFAVISY